MHYKIADFIDIESFKDDEEFSPNRRNHTQKENIWKIWAQIELKNSPTLRFPLPNLNARLLIWFSLTLKKHFYVSFCCLLGNGITLHS